MKGTFKKAVALGSAIALVGGLAACGSSSGDGTAELKFQTWNLKNEKFTDYFEGLIDQFEKENPGITIKWVDQPADNYEDKLSTDAAAGELPDVVDMGPEPAYTLASAGILLNLADAVPEAEDDFLPAAWDAATLKGTDLEEGTYGTSTPAPPSITKRCLRSAASPWIRTTRRPSRTTSSRWPTPSAPTAVASMH